MAWDSVLWGQCTAGRWPFGPCHVSSVPHLLSQAQGSGGSLVTCGSGLMRASEQPCLSTRHWNPSTPSYLPGQTLSLTAAVLT